MSKAIKLCSILLSVILLLGCVLVKAETLTAYINGENVNIRAAATTSSASIGKVHNDTVTVLESTQVDGWVHPWYKVKYGTTVGYIYGDPEWFVLNTPTSPPEPNPDADKTFEESLKDFPESYHSYLRQLHAKYPNWKFVASKLTMSFDQAVNIQNSIISDGNSWSARKVVELSQGIAWRSMQKNAYDWQTGKWTIFDGDRWVAASKEVVAYYMDPRNFLDSTYIYMFLKQSYDDIYQTEEGLAAIINGTFLANHYEFDATNELDKLYGGSYSAVIMAAAKASGVSPYIIASKIITEQGVNGTSGLISGNYSEEYKGYYNFINWGASGIGNDAVIRAGLQTAKNEGWNSRAAAIIGGAQKLADGYINNNQDTYYYMAFNLINQVYWHQYESAIYAAKNKAYNISKTYSSNYSAPLVFSIPVFTDIPDTVATMAAVGDNRYNNYYLTSITVDGLSPAFDMYTQSYTINITGNTTVYVKTPSAASVVSASANAIVPGTNTVKITVKSESGFTNDYILSVVSTVPCTLTVTTGDPPTTPPVTPPENPDTPDNPDTPTPTVKKGDINGDGKINSTDITQIKLHMFNIKIISEEKWNIADINGDGRINSADITQIKLHMFNIKPIV